MDTRRRIDLCTCGKPREDIIHSTLGLGASAAVLGRHVFMPNPQPTAPPSAKPEFTRITAYWNGATWTARVQFLEAPIGHGQAAAWLDAINAAIEDLKEKS